MDSADMDIFLTVARTGNVSAAALALHTTQSALSKRLKNMEEALGFTLFIRGKGHKGVELTSSGVEFMELAQRWQGLWQDMQALRTRQAYPALNIGVLNSTQPLTVRLSHTLYAHNPDIRVRFQVRDSATMYDEIDKRVVDVGFCYLDRKMPSVSRRRLYTEPFVVLSTEKLAPDGNGYVKARDLDPDAEVFVRWYSPGFLAWHENNWDMHRSQRLCTSSSHLQLAFLGTLGKWGIMPYSLAREAADNKTRFMYGLDPEPPSRVCLLLKHKQPRAGMADALQLFDECLEETLRDYRDGFTLSA